MQFKVALIAAAFSTAAVADFAIITVPIPTAIPSDINGYISSLQNFVTSKFGELTASIGPSAVSQAASAHTALVGFAKTASYSIPSAVTDLTALETFTTTPAWYTALPSDVKAYYDAQNARAQSLLNEAVLGANATTPTAKTSGSGSATGSAAAKQTSGAASADKVVGILGAGVAAAFAGVMAL